MLGRRGYLVKKKKSLRRRKRPPGIPHTEIEKGNGHVRLTPWALQPFLVGVLSAAAEIRKNSVIPF